MNQTEVSMPAELMVATTTAVRTSARTCTVYDLEDHLLALANTVDMVEDSEARAAIRLLPKAMSGAST